MLKIVQSQNLQGFPRFFFLFFLSCPCPWIGVAVSLCHSAVLRRRVRAGCWGEAVADQGEAVVWTVTRQAVTGNPGQRNWPTRGKFRRKYGDIENLVLYMCVCILLYYITLYYIIVYYIILFYTILHYTILYYIIS